MIKTTFAVVLLLFTAGCTWADGTTYDFTVNTATISGTAGYLDFQFNPGPTATQSADMEVLNFATDGTLGDCSSGCNTGDVNGALPGTLNFDNGTPFNDYFTGLTFGSIISFQAMFSGPAITSPNGTSSSASSFSFFLYDTNLDPLLSTNNDGTAAIIDINLDGSTTPINFSNQIAVTSPTTVTPEPSTFVLCGLGLALMAFVPLSRKVRGSA